ncbi:hypothetical protein GBB76_06735 [Ancylobacter sp. TS-1]|nr:hypothetical protein GBB76_06735 [Ancylobacter sp. TS-1]
MTALGTTGLTSDTRAVVGGTQAADIDSTTTLGGLNTAARVDVGGASTASAAVGIGLGSPGSPADPGDPGSPGGPGTGPGVTPGTSAGNSAAAPGSRTGDMAAKKVRCVGVLSEPRAYDSGIVALCRDLVGG